jgi:hypothetical protein
MPRDIRDRDHDVPFPEPAPVLPQSKRFDTLFASPAFAQGSSFDRARREESVESSNRSTHSNDCGPGGRGTCAGGGGEKAYPHSARIIGRSISSLGSLSGNFNVSRPGSGAYSVTSS